MRHSHADLVHAWAENIELQFEVSYNGGESWSEFCPLTQKWMPHHQYRIKPTPKPDGKLSAAESALAEANERETMRLAGISTAAIGYWKHGDSVHPDYVTTALHDVADLYAKYAEVRAFNDTLQSQLATARRDAERPEPTLHPLHRLNAALSAGEQETALQQYGRLMAQDDEQPPVERLRFYLSLALKGQDWLDVEPFIDALPDTRRLALDEAAKVCEAKKIVGAYLRDEQVYNNALITAAETVRALAAQPERKVG